MKSKISLIAVNNYERERDFKREFKEIVEKSGFEVVELQTSDIRELVTKAKEADQVFLAFDATVGMNHAFAEVARELLHQNVKPVQIITSVDEDDADVEYASMALADVWNMVDPTISDAETDFTTLYYSYILKSYSFFQNDLTYEKDVTALEAVMEKTKLK